jgi:hypothetical protein
MDVSSRVIGGIVIVSAVVILLTLFFLLMGHVTATPSLNPIQCFDDGGLWSKGMCWKDK